MPSCQEEMGLQHKVWRFPKLLDSLKLTATARKLPIEQNLTSRKLVALTLVESEQRACLGEILQDVVLGGGAIFAPGIFSSFFFFCTALMFPISQGECTSRGQNSGDPAEIKRRARVYMEMDANEAQTLVCTSTTSSNWNCFIQMGAPNKH